MSTLDLMTCMQGDTDLNSERRLFLGAAAATALLPTWARNQTAGMVRPPALTGEDIALSIGHVPLKIDGRAAHGIAINGTVPGPLIRLREGQKVRIAVTNTLPDEDTSIH